MDILLRRADWPAAVAAMEAAGFKQRHVRGIDMFLDGPGAKARDTVHAIFAGEKVRPDDPVPAPDVTDAVMRGVALCDCDLRGAVITFRGRSVRVVFRGVKEET